MLLHAYLLKSSIFLTVLLSSENSDLISFMFIIIFNSASFFTEGLTETLFYENLILELVVLIP